MKMKRLLTMVMTFALMLVGVVGFGASSNVAQAAKGDVVGVVVKRQIYHKSQWSQANWSQTDYEFYLMAPQARKFAKNYDTGYAEAAAEYLMGLIPTVGPYMAGIAVLTSIYDSDFGTEIRDRSERGPVKFTVTQNKYGKFYGPVTTWSGDVDRVKLGDTTYSTVVDYDYLYK